MKKTLITLVLALTSISGAVAAAPPSDLTLESAPVAFFSVKLTQHEKNVLTTKAMSVAIGHASITSASEALAKSHCATPPGSKLLEVDDITLPLGGTAVLVRPTEYQNGVVTVMVSVSSSDGTALGEAVTSGTCTIAAGDSVTQTSVRLLQLKGHQSSSFALQNGLAVEVRLDDVVDPTAPISEDDCSCTVKRQ